MSLFGVSLCDNTFGKGINSCLLSLPSRAAVLFSFSLANGLGEKINSEFKPVVIRLKTELVSHPIHCRRAVRLIFMVCQPIQGYFKPRDYGIAFIVHSYSYFCVDVSLEVLFCTRSYRIWITSKVIYMTQRWKLSRFYHSEAEWTWE